MIRHRKVSAIPDGADATKLRPTDWNDTHAAPPFVLPFVAGSVTWTNMPLAATEFTGNPRTRADLTNVDDARIVVSVGVVGVAASNLRIQYSVDQSAWSDLTPASAALNVTGVRESAWAAIPAQAKADVFLRVFGTGGDGVADPQFRVVQLQVR